MNLIIDITISKEFDDEEEWYLDIRSRETKRTKEILKPMLDDGYKIVLNSTAKFN